MEFAADKYCAEFGGVKLFAEKYCFERTAAVGESQLLNGSVALRNGGAKAVRITLSGKSESPCAQLLDALLTGGEEVALEYGGMVFEGAILVSYSCKGESGKSEEVTAEFVCGSAVAQKEDEA